MGKIAVVILLLSAGLPLAAENIGAAPLPLLDASNIYSAFNLTLPDSPGRPPADAESQTQVGIRAQKLGITSQSALSAWTAAQALLAVPVSKPLPTATPILFNGSTASALNTLLANNPGAYVRVTSSAITIDQPVEISSDGYALDFGSAQITSSGSQPYMVRIDSAHNIYVTGGNFTSGNSAILVNKSVYVLIDHTQISGLTGDGVVVTGSIRVMVTHNRISGISGAGVVVNGATMTSAIEENDISNNLGQSNWTAAIVVTDRDVDLATNPQAIFDPSGYWPVFSPIMSRVNPPHDNLIAFNHIATNTSSGIYMDGSTRNTIYSNNIFGNAKEGLCLDNGATANVVSSNTIQQNGNRWGQSDQTLIYDFVNSRLPDGTAAAKLPGLSIDNGIYNVLYGNNISHNSGGGVKMVRTGFFNILGENIIESDNDGVSIYYRFFGIELGAAVGDAPSAELDFTPSRGNIMFSNLIRGSNSSGIFIQGGSDQNQIFNNVIMDSTAFAIESQGVWLNTAQNNMTNVASQDIDGCCTFTGRVPRGR